MIFTCLRTAVQCIVYTYNMHNMQHIDFNLLVALDALLDQSSVSRAALKLNLSATATSHSLARLRLVTGDPLLVRSGKSMTLTPRALELKTPVNRLVLQARELLSAQNALPLKQTPRHFVIRAPEGLAIIYGPEIYKRLTTQMPLSTLRFVSEGELDDFALRDGKIDLDIATKVRSRAPDVTTAKLFEQNYVAVISKNSLPVNGKLNLKRFIDIPQIAVSPYSGFEEPVDRALKRLRKQRNIVLTVFSDYGALIAVSKSNLIAVVSKRIAQVGLSNLGLLTLELPLKVHTEVFEQIWHLRLDREPAHILLRKVVSDVLGYSAPI